MEEEAKPILMVVPPTTSGDDATCRKVQMLSYEDFNLALRTFEVVPDVETDTRETQVDSKAAGELGYNQDQPCQTKQQNRDQQSQTELQNRDQSVQAEPENRDQSCQAGESSSVGTMDEKSGLGERGPKANSPMTGANRTKTKMEVSSGSEPHEKCQTGKLEQLDLNEKPNPKRKSQLHFLKHHLCYLKNLFKSISHDHPSNIFSFTEKYLDYIIDLTMSLVTKSMTTVTDQDRLVMEKFKQDPLWTINIHPRHDDHGRSRSKSQDTCSEEGVQGPGSKSEKRPKGIAAPNVRLTEDDRRSSAKRRRAEYLSKHSSRSPAEEDAHTIASPSPLSTRPINWDPRVQRRHQEYARADPRLAARGMGQGGRRSSHEQNHDNLKRRSPPARRDPVCRRPSRHSDDGDRPEFRGPSPPQRMEQPRGDYRRQAPETGEHSRGFRSPHVVQPQRAERPDYNIKHIGGGTAQNQRITQNYQNRWPQPRLPEDKPAELQTSPRKEHCLRTGDKLQTSPRRSLGNTPVERNTESPEFLCLSSVRESPEEIRRTPPPTRPKGVQPGPSTPVRDEKLTSQEDGPNRFRYRPDYEQRFHGQHERGHGPNSSFRDEGCRISTVPLTRRVSLEDSSDQFPFQMPPREQHFIPTSHERYVPPEIRHRGGRRPDFGRFPRRKRDFHQDANQGYR